MLSLFATLQGLAKGKGLTTKESPLPCEERFSFCPRRPLYEPCKYSTLTPLRKASLRPNMKAVCLNPENDPLGG